MSVSSVNSTPPPSEDSNQTGTTSQSSEATPTTETGSTSSETKLSKKDQDVVNVFLNSPFISQENKEAIENNEEKFAKGAEATEACMKRSKSNIDEVNTNNQDTIDAYSSEPEDPTQTSKEKGA